MSCRLGKVVLMMMRAAECKLSWNCSHPGDNTTRNDSLDAAGTKVFLVSWVQISVHSQGGKDTDGPSLVLQMFTLGVEMRDEMRSATTVSLANLTVTRRVGTAGGWAHTLEVLWCWRWGGMRCDPPPEPLLLVKKLSTHLHKEEFRASLVASLAGTVVLMSNPQREFSPTSPSAAR